MSFEVVLDHYWSVGLAEADGFAFVLKYMRHLAVPCFMTLSFFLSSGKFVSEGWGWYGRRLSRLLIPFWFWAVAAFVLMKVLGALGGPESASFADLLWQMGLGSSPRLNRPLWFQADLLILTIVLFPCLKAIGRRGFWIALGTMGLLSLTLQYTGVCANFFKPFPWESRYTLFRLTPMLLYAAIGLGLGAFRSRLGEIGLRTRVCVMGLSVWAVVLFVALGPTVFPPPPGPNLGYAGLELVAVALPMLAFSFCLPFDRLPSAISRIVEEFSRYSIGIYCLHYLLGIPMFRYVFPHVGLGERTIAACVALWVMSWGLCRLIALMPVKFFGRIVR